MSIFNLTVQGMGVCSGQSKLMEGYVFLILLLIGAPIVLAVWLIARAVGARQDLNDLRQRLGAVEREIARLRRRPTAAEGR